MNPAQPRDSPNRQLDVLPGERSGQQSEPGPMGVAAGGSHCDMVTGVDDTAHLNRLPLCVLPAGATAGFWRYYLPAGEGRKVLTPDPDNLLTSPSGVLHGIMDHVPRPRWNPTTPSESRQSTLAFRALRLPGRCAEANRVSPWPMASGLRCCL